MKSYQQFLAELKRRKVFRVAAIYGATSFLVLQAAELVLPGSASRIGPSRSCWRSCCSPSPSR